MFGGGLGKGNTNFFGGGAGINCQFVLSNAHVDASKYFDTPARFR